MEGREPSYTVGGNPTWYSHYGEQCGDKTGKKKKKKTLKKLEKKKKLPCDPASPLLGIHMEETRIERDTVYNS